jgi:hypothetical protein
MYAKNRGGDTRKKLNPDLVRAIRMDTRSNRAVARDYGVSHPTIIGIRYNRIWQHVA